MPKRMIEVEHLTSPVRSQGVVSLIQTSTLS